jgi:hypothetical protein
MKVLNKRSDSIPDNAVYVGRPTKWGNPFKIGQMYQGVILDRQGVIDTFEDWFHYSNEGIKLQQDLHELKGKDLVCWCSPEACHADILMEKANEGEAS